MSATLTTPDLRHLTDDQLADAWADGDDMTRAAITRELARRDRADRMAKARGALAELRAEGESAAFAQYLDADTVCRGELLSREGKAAGITDEQVLWRMPEEQAMRYCSEELRDYWRDVAPRITPAGYVRQRAAQMRRERAEALETKGDTDGHDADTAGTGLDDPEARALQQGPAASRRGRGTVQPGRAGRPDHDDTEDTEDTTDGGTGRPVQPLDTARGDGNMRDKCSHPHRVGTSKQCSDCPLRALADDDMQEPDDEEIYGPGGNGTPPRPQAPPTAPDARPMYQHDRLDQARAFYERVVYATPEQLDTLTLVCAVTHAVHSFNTVPRVVVTSPAGTPQGQAGECGKTTVTDVAAMLSQNAWCSDPTAFGLRSKFKEPDRLTLIVDDVGKIFGDNGLRGRSNPLYKLLAESYRRNATMSSSVDGSEVQFSTYCVAFLTGLGTAVPRDILGRSVRIVMTAAPPGVTLLDSLEESTEAQGRSYGAALHAWVRANEEAIGIAARELRGIHPKLYGRRRQIWGPMFAVAAVAGGDWPQRCLNAFKVLALDTSDKPVLTAEEQVLADAYEALADGTQITSAALLKHLRGLNRKLYVPQSNRELAMLMSRALGPNTVLHCPDGTRMKGWRGETVRAAYEQLMAALYPEDETEPEEDEFDSFFDEVTEVTEVTDEPAGAGR